MFSKFLLGQLIVSDDAVAATGRVPLDLVARHAVCDFGLATARRVKQNELALKTCDEIESIYFADPTDPTRGTIKVTTSASWTQTKIAYVKYQPLKGKK